MLLCTRCKKRPAVVFVSNGMDSQNPQGLCLVCAKELGIKPVNDIMEKMGITDEELEAATEQMTQLMNLDNDDSGDELFAPGGAATLPVDQMLGGRPGENGGFGGAGVQQKKESFHKKKRKHIQNFCTDLTAKARNGQLDNIIGREKEIQRVVQILSRRTKNNPCLIGEPGVGKTAVAEGLALRIARGEVPAKLRDKEVQLLDLTALVAGTQFRGQFESRIKGLVDEVKADGNVILFIDEVHNLVGTGDAEGSMNAANILKPALSRGEIQVIGATTFNEYRKYIEKDAALERRFQPVTVAEPSVEDAVQILLGIKGYYESYHRVKVSEKICRRMVVLAERYINDRYLPDKAIDLLDEACACAALRNKKLEEYDETELALTKEKNREQDLSSPIDDSQIDYEELAKTHYRIATLEESLDKLKSEGVFADVEEQDVAKVIELWTGIPASRVQENELKKLANLEDVLKRHIIGQDEAVSAISAAIRRSRVQISPRRHPASFIFVGPTGTGKTELVRVLSQELFDTPETPYPPGHERVYGEALCLQDYRLPARLCGLRRGRPADGEGPPPALLGAAVRRD